MADVQSNIQVNLDASQALAQLKSLQAQLAQFNNAIATSNKAAARAQANLNSNLINSVNATGKFQASIKDIKSSTDAFTDSLERNKFSTREYFRYAGGATKSFGRLFKTEFNTIGKVAEERVKTMQTQYIKMGRDANGAIKAIAVRPLALDMNNLATKTALAAQKQQLLNQLLKQGSTNLLNFGKNTQWAGRQLMVGFTVPLSMLGVSAGKTFMALEKQAIRFKRVYGEMFTTTDETNKALKEVELLAKQFTKYGVAVEKTMQIAADAAATGKMGADLMAQVAEATRLAVLGGVEQEQALETTISLTNAFGIEADKLRGKIDFLNAVENQTVLNIEDLTIAIPKAAPVIRQLGGDVEDLAFFMTAMKEGGINASEGANALKSGLASLINPSKKASAFLADFGVNIKGIVESNKGDIKSTVVEFAQALDTLDPLNRARAIEQLFGKFQFSRLSTLFQNITKDGTQASRTLKLSGASVQELAILSERELKKVEDATGTKFKKSMEDLKLTLAPIGEQFLKAVTPIVEFIGKILEKFNGLSDGVKSGIVKFIGIVGLIGPAMLMTFGLIANGAANIIKLFVTLRKGFVNLGGQSRVLGNQTQYMTSEQIEATTVAASLDQAHSRLRQTFLLEAQAANQLTAAYQRGSVAANNFAKRNPGMMRPGFTPRKFNKGGDVPGTGNTDTVPAMLTPGEFVVNKEAAQENRGLLQGLNNGGFALRGVGTKMLNGYDKSLPRMRPGSIEYAKAFVAKRKAQQTFLGMPAQNAKRAQERQTKQLELDKIATETYKSPRAKTMLVTNPGERVSPSTGRSFPSSSVGGIYKKPNGDMVFVKPMPSEKAALAEMRATEIARDVHGLVAPQQKLTLIADPNDPTGHRRYFALESKVDPRIANVPQEFTKEQTIKQLVASTLRGDKDLAPGNIGGNVLADTGPAGVFSRASGPKTEYAAKMPSMEEQAMVNLLGVNGGARKFFAQSTSDIAKQMSPVEYDRLMKKEINAILPKLKTKIGGMNLSPEELPVYEAMIARLEAGSRVDWTKFQAIHAAALNKGGFVERQFGTDYDFVDPKHFITPNISASSGVSRTVMMHFEDAHGELDPKLYHNYYNSDPKSARFNNRISSGVTIVGPEGYNQLTNALNGANIPLGNISEPYPLTYKDAVRTKHALHARIRYDKILYDRAIAEGNVEEVKRIATRQKLTRIALAELVADARTVGKKPTPEKAWNSAIANRYGLTTAALEGEDPETRSQANSIYAKKVKDFENAIAPPPKGLGLRGNALRNHLQAIALGDWQETVDKSGKKIPALLRDKNTSARSGSSEWGAKLAIGGPRGNKGSRLGGILEEEIKSRLTAIRTGSGNKAEHYQKLRSLLALSGRTSGPAGSLILTKAREALAQRSGIGFAFPYTTRRRSLGTGGYGEPETVPALLTPGEFIASPALAQQVGPALQYINAGGKIEQRSNGTIVPGTGNKDTVPMILSKGSFVVNKGSTEENKGFLQRLNKGGLVLRGEGNPFDNVGVYDPDQLEAITPDMTPEQRKHTEQRNREIARRVRTTKVINKIDAIVEKTPIGEKHRAKQRQEEDRQKQEEDEIKRANQRAVDEVKDKEAIQKSEKQLIKTKNKIAKIDYQMAQAKKAGDTDRLASLKRAKENAVQERKNAGQAMNSARETARINREMNSPLPPPQTNKDAKKDAKMQRRERGRQIGQRAGGAMMGASMAMGALSMAPGKTGEIAQTLMPIVGLASMVAPMIGSPLGAVVAPLAAFGAAVIALNVIFDNAQAAALKLGETTGTSTKAINQYAIFANRVTKSEIQDRKRIEKASGLPIKPGKTTFGQSYVQTKEGQESIAAIGQTIINDKKGGREKATKDLSAQLITSVLSGALSSSEAQSIAANIGVQMKDHTIGMTVAAEIQGIFGKDGKDLLKEGVDLQVRLMSDSSKNLTSKNSNFDKLNQQSEKGLSAFGTKTNVGGMVAAGAGAGAAIGAGIGSFIPVPVLGTAIGALVGTAIGGIVGGVGAFFANKKNVKKMGALSGAAIADAQGMFEQSKQLLDAHQEQYESKRQELILQNKIGEATKLQLKYEKERADLTAAANTQRQNFAKAYAGSTGTFRESLNKGYKKAMKSKYKGTADEAYVDAAITGMDDLKDKTFTKTDKKTGKQVTEKILTDQERGVLIAESLAGTLSPQAQSAITNQMSGQYQADTIDVVKNFGGQVGTQAIGVTNAMNEGKNTALNERNKQEFMLELKTKATDKEAQDFANLVQEFTQLNGPMQLDTEMEFFLKMPDEDKLKLANDLQKIKDTKKVKKIEFLSEVKISENAVDQKYLQGLTDEQAKIYLQTIKKTLTIDLTTTVNSPEFAAWLATSGKEHQGKDPGFQVQKYAEYIGWTKTEVAKAEGTAAPKPPGSGGSAKRDDRFDDMLKKLKLFQQASVKATGGLKELERVMNAKPKSGGSAWMKFQGTLGQIRKLAKKKVGKKETALVGGKQVSAEYQDLIENLSPEELQDPKILKKYGLQTDKKGNITGLDEARVNVIEKGLVSGQTGQQINDIVKNLQKQKNINEAVNKLRISGMRYEEAINFVSTEGIAIAINKGEFTKEQVKDLVKLHQEQREANFNQKRFTDVAQLDAAESQSKTLEMARMYIELQERMIENEYVKEKTILDIQQGNNDYALELISRQEEKINESYDKQITALEEINRLREKENELTSKRMSIAAALSSGDMASAASAMQDYREAKIAQNARTRMEALQKAKENAIKGVTSPGGKSRTELEKLNQDIEQRRIDIENEIREKKIELDKITQTKMKLTKDQIDSAISTINLAIEALGPEAAKSYLKNIFTVLDGNAETTRQTVIKLNKDLDTFLINMDAAREKAGKNPLLGNIPTPTPVTPTPPATGTSTGGSTGTTPAPAVEQIIDSTGELTITPNKVVNGRLPSVDETVDTLKKFNEKIMRDFIKAQGKTPPTTNPVGGINYGDYLKIPGYRGAMGGMVPKYMASGGLARGTDTVPAMLTPGEFVINKNATQKFGPLLSAINSPTFTTPEAMSSIKNLSGSQTEVNNSKTLYNYNLSVNVSNSNANPNDIARTVINQIKQIDNQRIRSL